MGDNPRHPNRTKRSWSSVGEPARDVRGTGYHPGKKGRRDAGSISRRSIQPEYGERVSQSRRPSREYSAVSLERRPDLYSPKVSRTQPRYQSPLKPSPRLHDNPEKECSPRLVSDVRRQVTPRDHSIYPRHHWMQPWSAVGPSSEGRWAEQPDDAHHVSQPSRQTLTPDAQAARSFSGDPLLPVSSRGFSSMRTTPVSGEERSAVKLEPRGVGIGRQSSVKADAEDVKLEPRTRTVDESDRGGDTGPPGRKKRLGFGDSVYKRQQQYGATIGVTSPKPPEPPAEPIPAATDVKEEEIPEKQLNGTRSDGKELTENVEPAADETNDLPKDPVPLSMAESIVAKMNKLDDEIRELNQIIAHTEKLHEEVGQAANDLAVKVEIAGQEGNECPEADIASCLESDNGESHSNFVIMSPSGGSQSGEVDATGKLGPAQDAGGLIEQSRPEGPASFPPVSASKTLSVRSGSEHDASTSSRGDCGAQGPNNGGAVSGSGDVFGDARFAQVLERNIVTAQASYNEVWKGLPAIPEGGLVQQPHQELEIQWDGSRVLPLLRTIQKWKREQAAREQELACQYANLLEEFQQKLEAGNAEGIVTDATDSLTRRPNRTSRGARSDYGEFKLVQELIGREDLMTMVKLPDRIVYPWQGRMWINRNRLVKDPAAALQASLNRSPWTDEEKKTFMEKFIEHPKDFRTIATFLDKRSTSECIDLYYRIQKLDEFAGVRRKQQVKKRRQNAGSKKSMIYPHLMLSPSEKALRFPAVSPPSRSRMRGSASIGCNPYAGQLRCQGAGQNSFSRYQLDDFPWSDEEFMDAIRCHRTDIRAIAEQYGCKVQLVGTFVLDNRRRLGLDDIFAGKDKDACKGEDFLVEDPNLIVDENKGTCRWLNHDVKNDALTSSKPLVAFDKSIDNFSADQQRLSLSAQTQVVKPEDGGRLGLDTFRNESVLSTAERTQNLWAMPTRDTKENMSNLSLFMKESHDTNPVISGQTQIEHTDLAGAQPLPTMHPQIFQAPLNALSATSSLPGGQAENHFPAAAGLQSNAVVPTFLTPEMCALLGHGVQPLTQQPQPLLHGPRNISDASSSAPGADAGIDPLGPTVMAYPGRSSSMGNPYSLADVQTTLRPSLLSGSGDIFAPQSYPHEEAMMGDGFQSQHLSVGREEAPTSSELPGGLNTDAKVLSILLNLLSAQVGPTTVPPDNQINSFLAAAIQLLYGAGNSLLMQPPATQPPMPSDASQPAIPTGQAFHPLFLAPQSASSSMPYPQANPSLDSLGYIQGLLSQQFAGQSAAGSSQVGPITAQESLQQVYGSQLVQLLLAGMMMNPHVHAALRASQAVQPPDRLLYQSQVGISANYPLPIPEIPMSASLAQATDAAAAPGLGTNPNCGERIWNDTPTFGRDNSSAGVSSPGNAPATGGSDGTKL